MIYNKYLIKLI